MSIAKSYHLKFKLHQAGNFIIPSIICDIDAAGFSINIGMADFIESNGASFSQNLIDEIKECSFTTSDADNLVYEILSIDGHYKIGLYNSPNRIGYLESSEVHYIPVADFIAILEEWRDFLNAISTRHSLSQF